ncbi:MAG: AI-2E family transporter [Nitriliruptorales bacterium]|nr:AI-2E family transporter [Nitriliruptorales bacterium]
MTSKEDVNEATEADVREPAPTARSSGTAPTAGARPSLSADEGTLGADAAARSRESRRSLVESPFIRMGIYGWAFVGILALLLAVGWAMQRLSLIVIPLILALFPAAVLTPPTAALKRYLPNALASLLVILGVVGLLAGTVAVFVEPVSRELGGITESAAEGAATVQRFLEEGPFGLAPVPVDDLIEEGRTRLQEQGAELTSSALSAVGTIAEGVTGLVFVLVALFFYLKDGPIIAAWLPSIFPARFREDAQEIGYRVWQTVGAYIRGQLFVAFVDGLFIGLGLWILGVPLALPLGVLVFFFSLFPIVGAVVSGVIATLVALATNGLATALLVLLVVVIVQQVESNVLAPVVLGRATELHPLATIVSLAAGGILLGVLGAFIAVPIVASAARAVHYLRTRAPT